MITRLFAALPVIIISLFAFTSCEKENWALVDPPAGADSIKVRFLNFCGDGGSRSLSLDSKVETTVVGDFSASPCVNAPADSAFVSLLQAGNVTYSVSQRLHFSKQSNEILIAVPSMYYAPKFKSPDTLLHLSTARNLLKIKGYASLRMVVFADDSNASYEMRVGCPNGSDLGSATSIRQSTTYLSVPAGAVVISLIRNSQVVGIYRLDVFDAGCYSLIVGQVKGVAITKFLDELNTTGSALTVPPTVSASERVTYIRTVNFSRTAIDSLVASNGGDIAGSLGPKAIGTYRTITACVSDQRDVFQLFAQGAAHQSISTSMGVLARATIVCFDSIRSGTAASQMVIVPPDVTQTPADSVSVRVVNCLRSGTSIRVRLGARNDESGQFHNGELLCATDSAGSVSASLRVAPGVAPITVMTSQSDRPEQLLGAFIASLMKGKQYICIIGDNPISGDIEASLVESGSENGTVTSLARGVFTQVVHARHDRVAVDVSLSGVVSSSNLTFGNSLATVLPQGQAKLSVNGSSKDISADTARRMTIVLCGNTANPDAVSMDLPSMNPVKDTSRSRFLNVSADAPNVRFSVDTVANLGYNVYADAVTYGNVSPIRTEANPHRINLICADATSLTEVFRPNYAVTLLAGKAYTVILCGNATTGYALILQQEY